LYLNAFLFECNPNVGIEQEEARKRKQEQEEQMLDRLTRASTNVSPAEKARIDGKKKADEEVALLECLPYRLCHALITVLVFSLVIPWLFQGRGERGGNVNSNVWKSSEESGGREKERKGISSAKREE